MARHYLACDLGAESGRLMLGTLDGGRVRLEEIHRFPNGPVRVGDSLLWDIGRLWEQLVEGLKRVAQRGELKCRSISTDSWGVDYVLIGADGAVALPVHHYRDPRTARGVERVHGRVPHAGLYAETGIQFMPLNTVYQLAAEETGRLERARELLTIGDAFNYFLSGVAKVDQSNASTTSLYDPRVGDWSERLIERLGFPRQLFPEVVAPGTRLGGLLAAVRERTGLGDLDVIATCSHDTGAAIAAVPAAGESAVGGESTSEASHPEWAYLSSGTWSLLGAEIGHSILSEACRLANFTNEIGYGNRVRLLKNIAGLWLVQECRRQWAEEGVEMSYAELAAAAAGAAPFRSLIDPGDGRFVAPGGMPGRIAAYCVETGQAAPRTPGEFIRCCLESLALAYAETLRQLESVLGSRIRVLHIVGGGSQNDLLNQLTAETCGVRVMAGPVEATALGNVMVQAIALGDVGSLREAREIVGRSFPLRVFEPRGGAEWEQPREMFRRLRTRGGETK